MGARRSSRSYSSALGRAHLLEERVERDRPLVAAPERRVVAADGDDVEVAGPHRHVLRHPLPQVVLRQEQELHVDPGLVGEVSDEALHVLHLRVADRRNGQAVPANSPPEAPPDSSQAESSGVAAAPAASMPPSFKTSARVNRPRKPPLYSRVSLTCSPPSLGSSLASGARCVYGASHRPNGRGRHRHPKRRPGVTRAPVEPRPARMYPVSGVAGRAAWLRLAPDSSPRDSGRETA